MKCMHWALATMLLVTTGAYPAEGPAGAKRDARLFALHLDEARRWTIWVDPARTKQAEFVPEPIYRWTNPSRANGQTGATFVWTYDGRPVVLGGVFSNPEGGRRVIMHELHALGEARIIPELRDSPRQWHPTAAVPLVPLPNGPPPESTPVRRTRQMQHLARDFSAHTIDDHGARWQLRLLSRPLYRYGAPEADVVDGALFAFVSNAGTDPEVIVALEAVKDGTKMFWRYRAVRFSISSLHVQYRGNDIWESPRDAATGEFDNPGGTYALMRDRLIDELPEMDEPEQKQ